MKPTYLVCAVLVLMAGCSTSMPMPAPIPTVAASHDDSQAASIEKDLKNIATANDFTSRYSDFTIEAYKVIADCRDVDAETWDARRCDSRKKKLHSRKAKIDREYAAWNAANP